MLLSASCSAALAPTHARRTASPATARVPVCMLARAPAPPAARLRRSAFVRSSCSLRASVTARRRPSLPHSRRAVQTRALAIVEEVVVLDTPTGPMHTLVLKPASPGRYPAILFYSEIFQVTGPIRRSAAMLACHGFVVAVPDIYHETTEGGSYLDYDGPGADRGNELKVAKAMDAYDSDAVAALAFLQRHPSSTGKVGTAGFCIGGHLAFRAALQPAVLAAAVWYPTDIHKGSPDSDNTLLRVRELKAKGTEMLMIWGRQDPHIDRLGRKRILNAMMEADVTFSWHEYNGQHAFMRDEGYRYDGELAMECYTKAVSLFRRKLNEGDITAGGGGRSGSNKVESRH